MSVAADSRRCAASAWFSTNRRYDLWITNAALNTDKSRFLAAYDLYIVCTFKAACSHLRRWSSRRAIKPLQLLWMRSTDAAVCWNFSRASQDLTWAWIRDAERF